MASITISPEHNPGTLFTEITGNEKLKGITSDGIPINIGINQVLNKVEDKVDEVVNESLNEKIDQEFSTIIDEKVGDLIDDKLGDEIEKNLSDVNSAIENIVDSTAPEIINILNPNDLLRGYTLSSGQIVANSNGIFSNKLYLEIGKKYILKNIPLFAQNPIGHVTAALFIARYNSDDEFLDRDSAPATVLPSDGYATIEYTPTTTTATDTTITNNTIAYYRILLQSGSNTYRFNPSIAMIYDSNYKIDSFIPYGKTSLFYDKIQDAQIESLGDQINNIIDDLSSLALRSLFLAEGAVYNDTGADIVDAYDAPWGTVNGVLEKITHKAGCWYLNGIGDITDEEMLNIYRYGRFVSTGQYSRANCRTNIPSTWVGNGAIRLPTADLYYLNNKIEVSKLSDKDPYFVGSLSNFINQATKLKYIIGTLYVKFASWSAAFIKAQNLINLKIKGLGETTNVSTLLLDQSPNISQESILFAISNASLKVSATITLHPDAYARLSIDSDIISALETKNQNPGVADCTISLVSA